MKRLRLFVFLLENARSTLVWLLVAGTCAGVCSAALLALITHAVTRRDGPAWLLFAGFSVLVAGKIMATVGAQLLLVRFSQGTILELSLRLSRRVLDAPLRLLERRGGGAILATLTDDVSSVTWAVQCLPQLAMNLAILAGSAIYLAWLSWQVFAVAAAATLLGALVYKIQNARAFKVIHAAREHRSTLLELYRSMTLGMKELMMHRGRREQFMEGELRGAADAYRKSAVAATTRYAIADAWVQFTYHALIALVLFGVPLFVQPTVEALTSYVFAMVYLMAPMWSVIGAVPEVARGQVALLKIEELGISLDAPQMLDPVGPKSSEAPFDDAPTLTSPAKVSATPATIEMRQVVFHYEASDATTAPFTLGPIDLSLRPGELIFVVGGNGSGKSTFVKVLAGLYRPGEGLVLSDGVAVTDANRASYRERFSVVFSDFYLFDKLLGLEGVGMAETGMGYLRHLQLDHKVDIRGGRYSTTDLSQGQRKRLALVTAYLEDRPVYVFDEWAADQDPEYKKVFYSKLLPDLRDRGKIVVVITHDDRYFHLGDRILKLEDGKVAGEEAMK